MEAFDLQKALAGEPVITRDGRPVKIAGYNPDANNNSNVIGWVGKEYQCWYSNGWYLPTKGHDLDLFMAPKPKVKREGWVNIYRKPLQKEEKIFDWPCRLFLTKKIADEYAAPQRIACVKIEWEEEE